MKRRGVGARINVDPSDQPLLPEELLECFDRELSDAVEVPSRGPLAQLHERVTGTFCVLDEPPAVELLEARVGQLLGKPLALGLGPSNQTLCVVTSACRRVGPGSQEN